MNSEIYLSVAQAADLLGVSQESLYKEIQAGNLNATEHADKKRKGKVIAVSELSRLYGNVYIPEGYLDYTGDRSVDIVRVSLRQENERLRKALEDIQKREQGLNAQLAATLQNHKTLIEAHAALTKPSIPSPLYWKI
ncbi:hypothetical protein C6503_03485 [Candidatus Poribacteria bacterium]|nr:MAG: hypothetical protein C6503_03485 [Candidatus Poribacteria bacterium]